MKSLLTVMAYALAMLPLLAQQSNLTGIISDGENGEPLIAANVIVKKAGVFVAGGCTDFDGKYQIQVDSGHYEVEAQYIGYPNKLIENVVIKEGENKQLDISLSGTITLDEVCVVAYKVPLIRQYNTCSVSVLAAPEKSNRKMRKSRKRAKKKGNKKAKNSRDLPRKNINSLAASSAGLSTGKASIKGSRNKATEYYMDGVRIKGTATKQQASKTTAKATKTPEKPQKEEYSISLENEFISPNKQARSTFGIDVDHAAYSNVRRFILSGQKPPRDAVRSEEMINYFDYDYPQPLEEAPFSIYSEMAPCPWNEDHYLLHLGLHGEEVIAEQMPPSNLVFLIDVSGSMRNAKKLELLKPAFKLLVDQLKAEDQVAIVVYAGAAGLALPTTSGRDKQQIKAAIDALQAGGSTAGGAGIQLAYKTAQATFLPNGNNRVILATDGDFNIGISNVNGLERMIEKKKKAGIFLTVLGFGYGNLKDDRLEILADKGNGHYAYIDNLREAKKVFVDDLVGTLYTIAKDVKIQVDFDPNLVDSYRLIGYENRMLEEKDFDDDTKDAGELGAGHTVTALYEIVPKHRNMTESKPPVKLRLRYKLPRARKSKLIEAQVNGQVLDSEQTSDNFRFSAAVAGFSLLLQDSRFKGNISTDLILHLANNALSDDPFGYRDEFVDLVERYEMMESVTVK